MTSSCSINQRRICVIGAGIVGLTTAVRLQQTIGKSIDITIVSAEFSPNTTGDVAAGYIYPYALNDATENITRWTKETIDYYITLLKTRDAPKIGIQQIGAYELYDKYTELPPYASAFPAYRHLETEEFKAWPNHNYKYGHYLSTLIVECKYFLPYLLNQFIRNGGKTQRKNVESLNDLAKEGFEVVFNCTGIGAHKLVPDSKVYPIRGQIIRVKADWINSVLVFDNYYIIPNKDNVVLGGTKLVNNWSLEPDLSTRNRILNACTNMIPSLADAEMIGDYVGLRPGRDRLRIEIEHINVNNKNVTFIHNYGHGGSGITIAWGTAGDAIELLLRDTAFNAARL